MIRGWPKPGIYCFDKSYDFYWEYHHCLYDLPHINWKITKFDEKGFPYSYINRLDPCCPTLVEDGGYIENIEIFKQLYEEREEEALEVADFFLRWANKIMEYLPEDGLELIHKSISTCAKVSNNPIYKQLLEKYNWNN